jgi:ABC-type antimicrobial peptide transport system permease subunit
VIGVVGNVRHSPLDLEAVPQIYVPGAGGEMVVRTKQTLAALAPAVRAALRQFGADVILGDFKSMSQIVDQAVSPKRLIAFLVGLFSLLALLLASIGIYGVIAYSVSQRTQELGIRLALGSPASAVLWLVLGEGMRLAFIGCVIGLIASLGLTRVIQALLFAVSPSDPFTFAASGLLLLAVAMIACWLPGRRAARVDPMVALRHE